MNDEEKTGSAEERKKMEVGKVRKNNLCKSVKSVDTSLYRMMNDEL